MLAIAKILTCESDSPVRQQDFCLASETVLKIHF